MKIICSTLNSQYVHSSLAPWCLKAGIDSFCSLSHSVKVIEGTVNGNMYEYCSHILSEQPDIVAFSCYIWNVNKILEACEFIRKSSDCIICIGGPEVEFRAREILEEHSYIDYVLSGEGEWSFSALIKYLTGESRLSPPEGAAYFKNGVFIEIPAKFHSETPPSPYCKEYFEALNGRIAYIEASRGCPFSCSYCLSGRLSGYRIFNYDDITENIIKLANSGTKTVKFIDRTFNADKHFCCRILDFIYNNYGTGIKKDICFHFEISGEIIDEAFINTVSRLPVGLCQFEIGIQSYNTSTLKSINRKSNLSLLESNISKLISLRNAHIHIDLIAGLPDETFDSFIFGFNNAFKLKADMLQLGFLKVLHGSDLRYSLSETDCRYRSEPPYEIISTHGISEQEMDLLKICEKAVDKLYNSGRFLYTVDYLLKELKLSPFQLMLRAGMAINECDNSLTEVLYSVYKAFAADCNKEILRDVLLCDMAESGVNIKIPDEMIRYDKRYKTVKKHIAEKYKENVKIVLLSSGSVFVVLQSSKKNLSGRHSSFIVEIDDIL